MNGMSVKYRSVHPIGAASIPT